MKSLLFCSTFIGILLSSFALNKAAANAQKSVCASEITLFPIWINGKYGYINQKGDIIISPKFRDLGVFNEGLAPARIDGRFGYINTDGVFMIPPIFDYATNFSEGFARVWQEGKLFFIDKNGQKVWNLDINEATDFEKGISMVRVPKDSFWVEKVLDTLGNLNEVEQYPSWDGDLAIINKPIKDKSEQEEVGIKAKDGKMIVPFGRYKSIKPFQNGFAEVEITKKDDSETGFINRKGELIFKLKEGMFVFENYFSEGLLAINTHTIPSDINSDNFTTWVDTTGKTVFEKRKDENATPFKTGRSFSGDTRNWYLMDKTGKQLGNNRFEWFGSTDFSANRVFVAHHDTSKRFTENEKWGVIDSMGEYQIKPKFDKVAEAQFQKEGILVAIVDSIKNDETEDVYTGKSYHWGLIDSVGNWLIKPKFTNINPKGFQNGLLYAETESVYGYVDTKGAFVWQAPKQDLKTKTIRNVEPLNVAFMLRSYNYVYPSDYDTSRHKSSDDTRCFAKKIQANLALPEAQLGIVVRENEAAIFQKAFKGMKAIVFNSTKDSMDIDVRDNCLYITMQALDTKGVWHNIEYSPSSWCGNSYYSVRLKSHEYWELTLPIYDGEIETSLRLAFSTKQIRRFNKEISNFIYSNIFKGKINYAQFWRKEGHTPTNLMDSYND
jgi:WG containing repeat